MKSHYRILVAASVVAFLSGGSLPAGEAWFTSRTLSDSAMKDPWAKMLADIDGDGFLDMVIGGRSGPLKWYRYPQWKGTVIAEGGYRTVDGEAGDIDGDGDLDIVMGGLLWYENPLPGDSPSRNAWTAHQVADHRTHDLELADLDQDGDLDIVTRDQSDFGAKAGNKVYIWRQDADDRWTGKVIDCPHGEGLDLGDIDGDGDQDVVIGGWWYENDGDIHSGSWRRHRFAQWHRSATVQVADINGDGRPDVVLSPSELKGEWYRLSWFEAPPDPQRSDWREHVIADPIECVIHGLVTADFNGDGAVDIAASEMHQGDDPDEVAVFINRKGGTAWDKQILSARGSHYIQAGDIGGDGDIDLVGANWSGPYQPIEIWENVSIDSPDSSRTKRGAVGALGPWWDGAYDYRVPVHVHAGGCERRNRPVETPVDLQQLVERLNGTKVVDDLSLRVVEVDRFGEVIEERVPAQFDKNSDDGSPASGEGTLTFLPGGGTPAGAVRFFHVYFGAVAASASPLDTLVTVTDGVDHEGQASFRIVTPSATYYYHKRGAGFAGIEDPQGNDWLSYHPGIGPVSNSGSGGKYRGIPNMGHPEGYCHPGSDRSTSWLLADGPIKATIASQSDDGKWACRWDIFPAYARMTVLKVSHPYWFLYEGTPAGTLDEDSDYCVRCDGTRTAASVRWDGDIPGDGRTGEWLYFGDKAVNRVLYLVHHEDDDEMDSYWPMNHEMTVFGFGRQGINKYMTTVPAHFTIGFCETTEFSAVKKTVHSACPPLVVTVGNPQARRP